MPYNCPRYLAKRTQKMSNQTTEEQQEIRVTVEEAEAAVSTYRALKRLKENEDYKLIIEKLYLNEQVLDQVSLLAHDGMRTKRSEIIEDLVSKSNLNMFLLIIEQQGARFEDDLREYKELQHESMEDEVS